MKRVLPHILFATFLSVWLTRGVAETVSDAKPGKKIKALLITGGCCHDYENQKAIIPAGIGERTNLNIEWTIIHQGGSTTDTAIPFYENPNWAEGFDVVVHNECFAAVKDKQFIEKILKPHKAGLPAVVIHCAMHCYRAGDDRWFEFCGVTSHRHGSQHPFKVKALKSDHWIMIGFKPWDTPNGELYFVEKVWPGATALTHSKSNDTGKMNVNAWVNLYSEKNTRIFGTTIGHHNETMTDPHYLNMLTRGFLWSIKELDAKSYHPVVKKSSRSRAKTQGISGANSSDNLAAKAVVKASSEESGKKNFAVLSVDGDPSTRWCANGAGPAWLEVDLGKPVKLKAVAIQWESNTAYHYSIEGAKDGSEWITLVDAKENEREGQMVLHEMDAKGIRFLRVNYFGSKSGGWGSIREIAAYSDPGKVPVNVRRLALAGGKSGTPAPTGPGKDSNGRSTTIHTPLFPSGKGDLEKTVRIPKGYQATIFGRPPRVNYPTFVKATADGKVFVSVDKNGSLAREPERGKIVQIIDTNADGIGDEYYDFVPNVDSPRGLEWDGEYLYVMHPPHLTRYCDTDGDHVADESLRLVDGIGFGFKDRPADHTSNGVTLGIDGWLYLAIGDFGFMKARGTDGRELQLRGGGVVRVRPDGSGLHVFARGTRNIYELAVSPLLEVFTRDNTNDGGGWDVRFHHFTGLEHHGYPSLFLHFGEDIIKPLADYGGGSGTGALWLAEPGFPKSETGVPLTVDWGRQMIYRHEIEAAGAGFREIAQHDFIAVPRANDIDVDGSGRLFVASWKDGRFKYDGEKVGYVAMVTPPGWKPQKIPEFSRLKIGGLVALLKSGSHIIRLNAQQEILRRKKKPVDELVLLLEDKTMSLETRAIALFTLTQIPGEKSFSAITKQAGVKPAELRALVFRGLGDRPEAKDNLVFDMISKEIDPRVINEMIVAIVRSGTQDTGILLSVLAQANSSDPIVAHTAIRAITELDASHICFVALDDKKKENLWRGAMKALAGMHREEAVHGILSRLERTSWAGIRIEALRTLARLYHKEGEWKGDSWGTRPDTSGPYYNRVTWEGTKVIDPVLKKAMSDHRVNKSILLAELNRNHIRLDDLSELLELVEKDPAIEAVTVAIILDRPEFPMEALPFLIRIAGSKERDGELRLRAATAMARSPNEKAINSAFSAWAKSDDIAARPKAEKELKDALVKNPVMENRYEWLLSKARGSDARQGMLAWEILFQLRNRKTAAPEMKEEIDKAIQSIADTGGTLLLRLINVIGSTRSKEWKEIVNSSIGNEDERVDKAALVAAKKLGLNDDGSAKKKGVVIAGMKVDKVLAAVMKIKGDPKMGKELFAKQTCSVCHTVTAAEPQKGPFLGNITSIYKRRELAEAILVPGKTIAQGFATNVFQMKDGSSMMGFVTKESATEVDVRDITGNVKTLKISEISKREKSPTSMMPPGLTHSLTVEEFASLISYLESLNGK